MNREQIQFALSRHLDGDLSAEDAARLEALLASDPELRQLGEDLASIDRAAKTAVPLPKIDWDRLADTISAATAQQRIARAQNRPGIRPANEAMEDMIVRSLTGDITSQEQRELDRLLETDAAAGKLLTQHRALDVVLQHALPRPDTDERRICRRIGNALAEHQALVSNCAAAGATVDEKTEQGIVALVDRELTVAQEAELNRRLATDAAARRVLKDHRVLETVLKHGQPLPDVDYDRLARHISDAVAEAEAARAQVIPLSRWLHHAARVAIAACVLLGLALVGRQLIRPPVVENGGMHIVVVPPAAGSVREIVAVDTREIEKAAPRVIEVSVGPSQRIARLGFDYYAAGAVVANPARIQVARQTHSAVGDDFGPLPY